MMQIHEPVVTRLDSQSLLDDSDLGLKLGLQRLFNSSNGMTASLVPVHAATW